MSETPTRSPLQMPESWDTVADGYAEHLRNWTGYASEAVKLAGLSPEDRVLDVGSGPGTLSFAVAPQVRAVMAIDFSPAMVAALERRQRDEAVSNVQARVMDAQALEFPDASFDAAFSLFAFMFFPDRAKAFAELYRVLRPGGRLVVATWGPIERRPALKLGFDALAEAMPELPKPAKGDLQSEAECEAEFRSAGFVEVSAKPFTDHVTFDSAEHYLDLMLRTGAPFAALRKRLGEEAWSGVVGRMRTAVEARLPAGGASLAAEALLSVGTKP